MNATRTDQAYPSEATGNDIITGDEVVAPGAGNATTTGNTVNGGQDGGQQTNAQ